MRAPLPLLGGAARSTGMTNESNKGEVITIGITDVPVALLEAQAEEHRLELAKLRMQLVRYRGELEAHGIDPPDMDGADLIEMWRDCRHVMTTASQFVMKLGTSKELLVEWGK